MTNLSVEPNPRVTFKVRHEDADVLVVDKPARMVTQPGLGHETDSLLNGLFARHGAALQNLGRARDFGLLHRLDREASGLLIVALRARAYDAVREAFESRRVRKYYWAVVKGVPREASGVIERAIVEVEGGGPGGEKVARVSAKGKEAVTAYRVVEAGEHASLVEARAVTGRLHQVRVHMDLIGCPILGDDLYGPRVVRGASRRLALHAHRVVFEHPTSGERVDVQSPWPRDLSGLLTRVGLSRPGGGAGAGAGPGAGGNRVESGDEVGGDAVGEEKPAVGQRPARRVGGTKKR